ncbi:hypothetical protein ABXV18_24650 [Vibrio owensii]|uniref:hypothetical protein n=1 Tax=Vibrio owensii TaxID=696485 RepID=UPI00339407B2
MCSDMNDVPSTAEELNRKTVEALAQMANNYEKGMMSEESFYQSLTAINLVTCGLIDEDVSEWLSNNLKEHCHPRIERRVFRAGTKVTVVLKRVVTEDNFTMIQMAAGAEDKETVKSYSDADDPIKSAQVAYNKLAEQLLGRGFKEIS